MIVTGHPCEREEVLDRLCLIQLRHRGGGETSRISVLNARETPLPNPQPCYPPLGARAMPWKKMRLRDSTVLARVNENGEPVAQEGRVEVRYNARSARAYHAGVRNLEPLDDAAILPDDHCPPAAPEDEKPAAKTKSTAKTTGKTAGVARVPVVQGAPPTESHGDHIIACSGLREIPARRGSVWW